MTRTAPGPAAFSGAPDAAALPRSMRRLLAPAVGRVASAAARGRPPAVDDARHVASLVAAAPPPAVARWMEAEGVSALVGAAGIAAPPATVARWTDTAERVARRAERLLDDRRQLAAALATHGVPWRPLKGAWLADHVYAAAALRPMADTDVWVEAADLDRADSALSSLGYRRAFATWKHAVYRRPGERVVDPRGEHPDNPRPVEVHATWGEGLRGVSLDVAALAAGAGGGPAAWPDGAAMLVHVAAHATVDALARRLRLLSLVDVAVLASGLDDGAWRRVAQLAGSPAAARFVWPALSLAADALGADVPHDVAAALERAVRPPLRRWRAGIDVDALGRWAVLDVRRPFVDIPRIWPLDAREAATVWRAILWPPRAALMDRDPALAGSRAWPLAYARHAGYVLRTATGRARRRWRPPAG